MLLSVKNDSFRSNYDNDLNGKSSCAFFILVKLITNIKK